MPVPVWLSRPGFVCVADRLGLSPRARELLAGCLAVQTEAEIAELLGLSEHTVRAYMKRLYRRMGVRSRSDLCVHAMLLLSQEGALGRLDATREQRTG